MEQIFHISLSDFYPLSDLPVTAKSVARVDDQAADCNGACQPCRHASRLQAAAVHGFGIEVLQAADRLVKDSSLWSPPPAVTGFTAGYLAN